MATYLGGNKYLMEEEDLNLQDVAVLLLEERGHLLHFSLQGARLPLTIVETNHLRIVITLGRVTKKGVEEELKSRPAMVVIGSILATLTPTKEVTALRVTIIQNDMKKYDEKEVYHLAAIIPTILIKEMKCR